MTYCYCIIVIVVYLHLVSGDNAVEVNLHGPTNELDKTVQQERAFLERFKRYAAPSSCAEVQQAGHRTSGIYTLQVLSKEIEVYCDLTTDSGGWTVVQRRDDYPPPLDFYQNWMTYKTGFGDLNKEFWLGLDNIHRLTSSVPCSLRIELEDFEGGTRFAKYNTFHIAGESSNYKLLVNGFSGDSGDSLSHHSGQHFSTLDRDNDADKARHCAVVFNGAWWYKNCHKSSLNGIYLRGNTTLFAKGVDWMDWRGHNYSLKKSEMKIRPRDFQP